MDLNHEIKPMSHTPSRRKVTWGGGGDGGWCSEKIARLEGSRTANKVMMEQIQDDVSVREWLHQIALTPLDTLLRCNCSSREKR
jgi:hypothetical protein